MNYRRMIVWQKAMDLTKAVYIVIRGLPSDYNICAFFSNASSRHIYPIKYCGGGWKEYG